MAGYHTSRWLKRMLPTRSPKNIADLPCLRLDMAIILPAGTLSNPSQDGTEDLKLLDLSPSGYNLLIAWAASTFTCVALRALYRLG
jgi:hypothetical protein